MGDVFRRFATFQPKWKKRDSGSNPGDPAAMDDTPKTLSILASTDAPVDWGGWREVLVHEDESIDSTAARALLLNHDPDQLCGKMLRAAVGEDGLDVDAELLEGAVMASGVSVADAVESGALRGISIGYSYDRADTAFDEETRTLTVRKWRLLETSLTPIPADGRAMVRSMPFDTTAPANPAALNKEARVSEPVKPNPQGTESAPNITEISEKARAAAIKEVREIDALARSVGLDASPYLDLSKADAQSKMLRDMAEKNKTPEPAAHAITITRDVADKARDAFTGALAQRAGVRSDEFDAINKDNPLRGQGIQHTIKRYAKLHGCDTSDWSKQDVASFALGRTYEMSTQAQRSAANISTGSFPNFVMLNAVTKIVARGFEQGSAVARYKRIVDTQQVPDFKTYYIGAMGTGNLQKTAEGMAFPELIKSEGVYSNTAKMWGGTLSLSLQALVNDDTSQFDRSLRMAGAIADKTIDRRVFQKLLMGTSTDEATSTYTSNTTSGGSLVYTTADLAAAARGRLALVRAALMNKVGLDGNPLGTVPRFLICGPTRYPEALAITGGSGPLLTAGVAQQSHASLEVIDTPWLEASALAGSSTTSYYLLGDPMDVTGLVLSFISGYETVQVQPYDAGAVAGMNWKLWLPFEADLNWQSISASGTATNVIAAVQQGTT